MILYIIYIIIGIILGIFSFKLAQEYENDYLTSKEWFVYVSIISGLLGGIFTSIGLGLILITIF